MKNIVIFDIDGTLADCEERRELAGRGDKFSWDTFFNEELMMQDKIVNPILSLALLLNVSDVECYYFTGRPEKYRETTRQWLRENLCPRFDLFMRKDGDYRPDTEVKKEMLLETFDPEMIWFVVDDRDSVVKMWRELGITCLQCAEGDF